MYVCVTYITFVWMILNNKEPQASKCNPIGMGLAFHLSLAVPLNLPPHPNFIESEVFLEKFMEPHHVSFLLCSRAFLAEGQEL